MVFLNDGTGIENQHQVSRYVPGPGSQNINVNNNNNTNNVTIYNKIVMDPDKNVDNFFSSHTMNVIKRKQG